MTRWKRDLYYGIVIVLAAVFGIIETQGLELKGYDYWTTRPDVYVWMWLALLGIMAIVMIARALIKKNEPKYQEVLPKIWCKEGVITIGLLVVYLLAMKLIGFIASTLVFEFVTMCLYGQKMGKINFKEDKQKSIKRVIFYLIVSVIATVATYYLFTEVLSVRLPKFDLF